MRKEIAVKLRFHSISEMHDAQLLLSSDGYAFEQASPVEIIVRKDAVEALKGIVCEKVRIR